MTAHILGRLGLLYDIQITAISVLIVLEWVFWLITISTADKLLAVVADKYVMRRR